MALTHGRDWELLADQVSGGDPATIEVVTNQEEFVALWLQRYPTRAGPEISINDPIFVFFNILVDAGCPEATIDAIMFDQTQRLVYGEFTRPPRPLGCGDVGGSHSFIVAINRGALPRGRLMLRLEREFELCAECGREREQVEVDL